MSNKKHIIRLSLLIIGLIITIVPIIGSLLNMYIDCDSAYYLSMVERISEGYVPYRTLNLGYTPLWFYIATIYKLLFNIPIGIYEPYLFLHYIFYVGCAFLIYKILQIFKFRKELCLFTSFLFVLMTHWLNGNAVLLEIPSMFFGLMSCYLVLKYQETESVLHYLWIGGICACSFLCKQFGLGFLPLALYLIIFFNNDSRIKKSIFLLIGYSIPIIACFIIWGKEFIPLILSGYGTTSAESAGYDVSIQAKLMQIIGNCIYHFKRINPIIILSLLFVPVIFKQKKWKEYLFCLCGLLGFMLQFYFVKGGLHYQLYTIPFSVMVIAILLSLNLKRWQKIIIYIFAGITITLTLYSTYNNRVYKLYIKSDLKQEQIDCAKWISENTEEGKTLFIVHGGLFYNYYLTNTLPANISTIGYSFGPLGLNKNECRQQIDSADYILRFTKDYPYESFFTSDMKAKCEDMPSIYYNDEIVLHIND